ncbi:MAG: hypothetical protein HOP30_16345 [Cyclobacteriaceae bacterium]|nr:hypothetical protein [Cyclobacteriaceae bacterium]
MSSPSKRIYLLFFVHLFTWHISQSQSIIKRTEQFVNNSPVNIELALKIFDSLDSLWKVNPAQAIQLCDSMVASGEKQKNIPLTIMGHFLYASPQNNDMSIVEMHFSRASFLVKANSIDSSFALLDGCIEYLWGSYLCYKKSYWSLAMQHLFKAELILENYHSPTLMKYIKMQLVNLTYNCSQFNVAINECFDLINNKTAYQLTDHELMLLNNNLGLIFMSQNKFDKSRFHFNSAIRYVKGTPSYSRFWVTCIKCNMANEFSLTKEYGNYISLFKEDIRNCKEFKDYSGMVGAYLSLAKASLTIDRVQDASNYLDSVNLLIEDKKIEVNHHASLAFNTISIQAALAKGDYSQIVKKITKLKSTNDTITRALNRRMGENAQLLAEASILQDSFTRNNLNIQRLELQKRDQRNLLIAMGLISVGAFFAYNYWAVRRNLKKTLQLNLELNQAQEMKTKMEVELVETKSELDRLTEEIELRKKQLVSHSLSMVQKNETLNEIKTAIKKIRNLQSDSSSLKDVISGMMSSVNQNFQMDNEWELFRIQFEEVDPGFFTALRTKFPELSETDLRFCALFKLNLNSSQVAGLLNITAESVKAARHRLRKKMKLKPNHNIHQFLATELQY